MKKMFALLALGGCATAPGVSRTFDAPPEAVSWAAHAVLADVPPDRDEPSEQGLFLGNVYRVRVRYRFEMEGSLVRVRADVERRAPGGPRSLRWERVPSEGRYEREFLDAVAERLKSERHP